MTRTLPVLLPLLLSSAVLAQSADVRLHVSGHENVNDFSILMAFINDGPDVARDAVLTIDVPAAITVLGGSFGSGNLVDECDITQRPIRCEVGDMHVGMPFWYSGLTLKTPIADASYTVTATLTAETPDPDTKNNSGSVTWQTRIEEDLRMTVTSQADRIDPGGEAVFVASLCNFVRGNRAPTVRVEFTATNGTIAGVVPATGFTCTQEGAKVVCTIAELTNQCPREPFRIVTRGRTDRDGGEVKVTARAFGDLPDLNSQDNESTAAVPIYRWLAVTTVADSGPGSLRQAITDANAGCTPGPCRIVFEIPKPVPAEGWFTIVPATPLPSITAERVTLEGDRQTAFTGNTNPRGPEIAIDGRLAHRGIRMLPICEGVVNGLAIGNFDEDQGLWFSTGAYCGARPDKREVTNNHIGTDPTATIPWPNLRGLRLDFALGLLVSRNVISHNRYSGIWFWRGGATISSNLIELNGASGVFVGSEVVYAAVNDNVILQNAQMGVALSTRSQSTSIRRNVMKDNGGLGIDWDLDGVSPADIDDHETRSNAPVLFSAGYDPVTNRTTVRGTLKSSPIGRYFNFGTIELFANDRPDGDGERLVGTFSSTANPQGASLELTVTGDLRGKWMNATSTREHTYGSRTPPIETHSHEGGIVASTSELSNSVPVQ